MAKVNNTKKTKTSSKRHPKSMVQRKSTTIPISVFDNVMKQFDAAARKLKIDKLRHKVKTIYVFFNNCHLGQAAANATEFTAMLDQG